MSQDDPSETRLSFETEVLYCRGQTPFFLAALPPGQADSFARLARAVTYGWGMIPVAGRISGVAFTTSLFPKDGGYLLPLKDAVRRKAEITAGDRIAVELAIGAAERTR